MTADKDWFIQDWYPMGHRMMDTAVEGSCKTSHGCWLAVCTAIGKPFLGQEIQQGSVVIIDEETPPSTLEDKISRFALSFGYDWHELPISIQSMKGFRFARKTALDWLLRIITKEPEPPMLLRMDSVIAMLPGFRQGMAENDSNTGIALKDDMDKLLLFAKNISISAHAKKYSTDPPPKVLRSLDMQSVVRGSGSIVGEAADSGLILKKISEYPEPTRYIVITKARRKAIPMSAEDVFVEMEEESYGKGWARLKRIDPIALPPSKIATELVSFFRNGNSVSAEAIVRKAAFYSRNEIKIGIDELVERRVVNTADSAFEFKLNPKAKKECDSIYLHKLISTAKALAQNSNDSRSQPLAGYEAW